DGHAPRIAVPPADVLGTTSQEADAHPFTTRAHAALASDPRPGTARHCAREGSRYAAAAPLSISPAQTGARKSGRSPAPAAERRAGARGAHRPGRGRVAARMAKLAWGRRY